MYQHIEELQRVLAEKKAAAALLRLPENIVLFSQYWPGYGFSFLFVPAQGTPTVICPRTELKEAEACGLTNITTFGDVLIEDGNPIDAVVTTIQNLARKHGIGADSVIATEMGEDVMAPTYVANKVMLAGTRNWEIFIKGLSTNSFIPIKDEIRHIRSIKTESDIQGLHTVNSILSNALDYFEKLIQAPGMTEIAVLAETESYFKKLAADRNARAARIFGQLSTGVKTAIGYADCILSDNRLLEEGDLAMFEVGACVDGYWADLTRTSCVGGFQGKKKEVHDIVEGSFAAGLAAAGDGATGGQVDEACRAFIERFGYGKQFVHPTGHGTGFAHSENYPVLAPGSDDLLRTGMVVAIEPGIYLPDVGGVRTEKNVLVGETGGTILGQ